MKYEVAFVDVRLDDSWTIQFDVVLPLANSGSSVLFNFMTFGDDADLIISIITGLVDDHVVPSFELL